MGPTFVKAVSITCVDLFGLNSFKDLFSISFDKAVYHWT